MLKLTMTNKQKPTSTSNMLSSDSLQRYVELEGINTDINSVIDKYAGNDKNVSMYVDDMDSRQGFFLMWVKKDLDAQPGKQMQITTFARCINVDEVLKSMTSVVTDIERGQSRPVNIA